MRLLLASAYEHACNACLPPDRPGVFQKLSRRCAPIIAAKKSPQSFLRNQFVSRRRARDADQKRNLLWFHCRRGRPGNARAGEGFTIPENQRPIDDLDAVRFTALPCLPTGRRWIVDRASMPGGRFP